MSICEECEIGSVLSNPILRIIQENNVGHDVIFKVRKRKSSAGEPEPVGAWYFGSLETEPLQKKTRSLLEKKSGAGAANKLSGSSALRED